MTAQILARHAEAITQFTQYINPSEFGDYIERQNLGHVFAIRMQTNRAIPGQLWERVAEAQAAAEARSRANHPTGKGLAAGQQK